MPLYLMRELQPAAPAQNKMPQEISFGAPPPLSPDPPLARIVFQTDTLTYKGWEGVNKLSRSGPNK